MDEQIVKVLSALPLPIAWATVVMLVAWWSQREGSPARPMESRLAGRGPLRAGGVALGGAMLLGAWAFHGVDVLRTPPGLETWPLFAALLATALGLIERWWEGLRGMVWIFRTMLMAALVAIWCGRVAAWSPAERAWWIAGFTALMMTNWWCLERAARRAGPEGPLAFWVIASITSLALIATGSLKGGAAATWLAAGCGAGVLTAIIRPRAGASLVGPATDVFAATVAALWFMGPNSGSMPLWMMIALGACAPASLLADLGPIKRLNGWKHALVRAALAAIPGVVVLAVALPQAIKDAEDAGNGAETRAPGNPASGQPV